MGQDPARLPSLYRYPDWPDVTRSDMAIWKMELGDDLWEHGNWAIDAIRKAWATGSLKGEALNSVTEELGCHDDPETHDTRCVLLTDILEHSILHHKDNGLVTAAILALSDLGPRCQHAMAALARTAERGFSPAITQDCRQAYRNCQNSPHYTCLHRSSHVSADE